MMTGVGITIGEMMTGVGITIGEMMTGVGITIGEMHRRCALWQRELEGHYEGPEEATTVPYVTHKLSKVVLNSISRGSVLHHAKKRQRNANK